MHVWVLGLSCEAPEVLGFTLPHSSKPPESRGQKAAIGPCPVVGSGGLGLGNNGGSVARNGGQAQLSQEELVRRTDAAATSVILLRFGWSAQSATTARRSTSWQWHRRWLVFGWTRLLFCVPPAHWNRGLFFSKAIRPSFVSGWLEGWSGIGTCWSSCFRVASGRRRGSRERRRGSLLPALPRTPGTMFHRCFGCPVLPTVRHARFTRGPPCGTFTRTAIRGTVCTWHFPLPKHNPPTSSLERTCPILRDGILEGAHLHGRLFVGHWHVAACTLAVVVVDELGNLKAAACGAVPCDVPPGQTSRDGEDHAAATAGHTIWTWSRCTFIAKVPSRQSTFQRAKFWVQGAPAHKFGAGFWFPMTRSGQSMSRCTPPCATWRQDGLAICSEGEMIVPTCL